MPDRADRPGQPGWRGRDHRVPAVRVGRRDALAAGRPGGRQEPDAGPVRSGRASERRPHRGRRGVAADQYARRHPPARFVRPVGRAALLPGVRAGWLARVHGNGQPGRDQRAQGGTVQQARGHALPQYGQRKRVEPAHVAAAERDAVRQRGVRARQRAQLPGVELHHLLREPRRSGRRRLPVRQVRSERPPDLHRRSGRQLVAEGVRSVGGFPRRRLVQAGRRHRRADAEHGLPDVHLAAAHLDQRVHGRQRQRPPRCRRAGHRADSEPGQVPQRQVQQFAVHRHRRQREFRRDLPAVQLVRGRVRYHALPRHRRARGQRRRRADRRAGADGQRRHGRLPGRAGVLHQGDPHRGLHRGVPAAGRPALPRFLLLLARGLLGARRRRRPAASRRPGRLDRADRPGDGPFRGRARLRRPDRGPRVGQDAVHRRRERRYPRARGVRVDPAVRRPAAAVPEPVGAAGPERHREPVPGEPGAGRLGGAQADRYDHIQQLGCLHAGLPRRGRAEHELLGAEPGRSVLHVHAGRNGQLPEPDPDTPEQQPVQVL